ncbi:hypothetical protein ACFFRR_001417 [Megaselia abdita]
MIRKLLCLFLVVRLTRAANILGLMGVPVPSHFQFNSAILHGLARRGHNVTILSVDLPKIKQDIPQNVHYIHLENVYNYMYQNKEGGDNLSIEDLIGKQGLSGINIFNKICKKIGFGIQSSEGFQELLNYPNNFVFDVVLYDYTKGGPFLLGFLSKFNYPPLIGVTPFLNPPITTDLIGNYLFPGYIPHWVTDYDVIMTFTERVHNTLIYLYDYLYRRYILTPQADKMFRAFYPEDTPYLGDLEKRAVLTLVNSNPAINYPESLPPNIIEVGGLQITDPQPLPGDIDNFINSSKKGSIYFSFGTNIKSEHLKERRIQLFLNVMTTLPQYNFLWKIDLDHTKYHIPDNVLVRTFFPQRDILGHHNIKVFVTHSGGLGTQEAIWFGVPMIGMALFIDQPRNLRKCVFDGIAAKLDYLTFTEETLRNTILNVTEDGSLTQNMKERSTLFRDQPMKPLDRAICINKIQ